MMKPKVIVVITLLTALLVCITASLTSAHERPDGSSRDTTRTSTPQPKATGKVSDLRVDHIWLDDQCRINLKLKNTGEHAIPDREHNQGMVRVYFGRSHEDFFLKKTSSQKKPAVDPSGALKSPGSTLPYNTGIELKEKLTVEACVGLNRITAADRRKGISIVMRPMCGAGPDLTQKPKEINIKPTLLMCGGKFPTIKGDDGDNVINGTPGDDVIHGMGGNDTIDGMGGNDIICGGSGNDTILGGPSTIASNYANCSEPWSGDHDRLYGGPGNDTLDGGPGTDCVFGEAGDDKLYGAEDYDTLDGGGGNDTYYFVNSNPGNAKVIEAPNANTDTLDFSQLPTQDGIDILLYLTNSQSVSDNHLNLELSSDTGIENLIGTPYLDHLYGNSRDNYIIGGDNGGSQGFERLVGREGNDTLMGGGGSDQLSGEFSDSSSGPPGDDILDGGPDFDHISGGPGNDQIIGGQGDDQLWGNAGNDQITGGQGDDFMEGGAGDDLYLFVGSNLGEDTVHEDPNVDTDTLDYSQFTGGGISAQLSGTGAGNINILLGSKILELNNKTGVENIIGTDSMDTISGNSRDNVFEGGAGPDNLYGKEGNDTLLGGDDNDDLRGGLGDDQLTGGSGNDMLRGDDGGATATYGVTWTAGVNVQINGATLTKNSGGDNWNAGAVSVETLAAGDGYVSTTVAENNTRRMIGLSNGNSSVDYTDIDFAVYLRSNGTLRAYEEGILIANGPSYQSGDEITVEVSGGTVYYKKNGNTFYTSSNSPSYPLLVDTSLFSQNATLQSVSVGGGFIQGVDTCDGGAGQDTAGPSCETKISIEANNPNM